ncbi:hypothetical protein ABPG72_021049 [Tetrahymena utriculariae]
MEILNFNDESQSQGSDIKLSKQQEKIVKANIVENYKILACAGSGKSTTLIKRIKFLIEDQQQKPEEIIVSTFNVEAANYLKMKAKQYLSLDHSERIKIINIDKFVFEIFEEYLSQNINSNGFKLELKEIAIKVLEFLKTEERKLEVLGQYKYFFFDEFQDINQIQYEILMLFSKNKCKITAIGDGDQSIYSFRQSNPKFLNEDLENDIPNIKTLNLNINYRSTSKITQFCNQVLKQIHTDEDFENFKMNSLKQAGEDKNLPVTQIFEKKDKQFEQIIKELKKLKLNNICEWNQIAILSPQKQNQNNFLVS